MQTGEFLKVSLLMKPRRIPGGQNFHHNIRTACGDVFHIVSAGSLFAERACQIPW